MDVTYGGAPFMLYYLELQQMALEAADGTTGPAARAAGEKLLETLPHNVVLAR